MSRNAETGQFQPEGEYSREELLSSIERFERQEGTVTRDAIVSHDDYPNRSHFEKEFGSFSEAKRHAGLDEPGRFYLTQSELDDLDSKLRNESRLRDTIVGLLMSDGSIPRAPENNCCMRLSMVTREFLEWLSDRLGRIARDIDLKATAEESARRARATDFRPDAEAENYKDVYEITTRRLPFFTELRERWYADSGDKQYPYDFDLSPTIAKMWYCGDGYVNIENNYAAIKCSNESSRGEKLEELLADAGFQTNYVRNKLVFRRSETADFFEWMGSPPPGFEYKWEHKDRDRYYELKSR